MSDDNTTRDLLRIARHEAAHLTVGRVLGAKFGGATIEANPDLGFSGLVWGPDFESHLADTDTTGPTTIEKIDALMPCDGDERGDVTDIYAHVHTRIIELTAGSEAEKMHFGDACSATDDRRQERQLAGLILSNSEAADAFIAACAIEARAILGRHNDVFDALTSALLEHRTIDGTQIDEIIARAVAASHLKQERKHRADWQKTIAGASGFNTEKYHG